MTGAALRSPQAFPCVGRDFSARYLWSRQSLVNVRVGNSWAVARSGRLARSSHCSQWGIGSLLLRMVLSASRAYRYLLFVHWRIERMGFLSAILQFSALAHLLQAYGRYLLQAE
jgi:hypothetical protein